jgi:hypothetical protein
VGSPVKDRSEALMYGEERREVSGSGILVDCKTNEAQFLGEEVKGTVANRKTTSG